MNEPKQTAPDFPVPDELKSDRIVLDGLTTSPTIGKIAAALAKAQGAVGRLAKASEAEIRGKDGKPGYSYTYATLADSLEAIRECFSDNGIAVVQAPAVDRRFIVITTVLAHESGEWFSSSLAMPVGEQRAQATGAAITYARRYALQSMAGIAPDDSDGSEADQNARRDPPPPRDNRPPPKQRAKAPITIAREQFGAILRDRKAEIIEAGGEWAPGLWQRISCAATGLEKWPDEPGLELLRRAIEGLNAKTLDELGVELPDKGDKGAEGDGEPAANSPADVGGTTSAGGWSGAGEAPGDEPEPYDPGDGSTGKTPPCPECGGEGMHSEGCALIGSGK